MQYGFGQISIDEMVDGFKEIIKRNNEFIQSSLQPFIPLYNWLRVVLQKTNDDEEISEQLVSANVSTDITEIKDDIDIKSIADYSYENNCLKVVLKTDKTVLEEKLRPLKKICDLSRMDNLPALNS